MKRPVPPLIPDSFEERWKPRRRTIALFGIMLTLVLWLGNACRPCYIGAGDVTVSKAFVGTDNQTIILMEGQAANKERVYLTDKGNKSIFRPSWIIRDGEIWYWSPSEKALCRVVASGKRQFIPLPKRIIPEGKWVSSLHATSSGFLLNVSSAEYSSQRLADALGTLYIPSGNSKQARWLPGLRDARGNSASKSFYGRDDKGNIVLWDSAAGPTRPLKQNAADWVYWDLADKPMRLAFVRDDEVGISDGERVLWTRSESTLYGVGFSPQGDVWVSEDTLVHSGGIAVLAADTGRFRGWRVRSVMPLRSPFQEVDKDILALLQRIRDSEGTN